LKWYDYVFVVNPFLELFHCRWGVGVIQWARFSRAGTIFFALVTFVSIFRLSVRLLGDSFCFFLPLVEFEAFLVGFDYEPFGVL